MTQRTHILFGTVLGLLLLATAGGVAYVNGLIRFDGWKPSLGKEATPDLDKDLVFAANFPEESREPYSQKIETARASLKANPDQGFAWLDLALLYRAIGDFESAADIWEYMTVKYPGDFTAQRNLGEYYFHTVKDYDRAEEYYRSAIESDAEQIISYMDLFEMYYYAVKDNEKATAILEEGISKVPRDQSVSLYAMFAGFYRDQGKIAEARAEYNKAREIAVEFKNIGARQAIDAELARLR